MTTSTRIIQALGIAIIAIPFNLQADSWSCRHNNDVREIHIQRDSSEPVPCSVVYKKLTEGVEDQVLWTAENDAEYCETKAKDFVEKQIGWGWTCVETIADDNSTDSTEAKDEAMDAAEAAPAAETKADPATTQETAQ